MLKKIVLAVVCAAALLFGVTFTVKNAQLVELNYYFGIEWQGPLSWLIILVLVLGILLGMAVCLVSSLKKKFTSGGEKSKQRIEST